MLDKCGPRTPVTLHSACTTQHPLLLIFEIFRKKKKKKKKSTDHLSTLRGKTHDHKDNPLPLTAEVHKESLAGGWSDHRKPKAGKHAHKG